MAGERARNVPGPSADRALEEGALHGLRARSKDVHPVKVEEEDEGVAVVVAAKAAEADDVNRPV